MNRVRTWEEDLRLRVYGNADPEDYAEVDRVVRELNELAGREMLRRVDVEENVEVRFTDRAGFDRRAPPEARKNTGYAHVWWDASHSIYRARILVLTEGVSRKRRHHIIREEITQALGILNDSWSHRDSIFYQGYSDVTEYSDLDKAVIRLHLANRALTGANRAQVRELLARHSTAGCGPAKRVTLP